MKHKKTKVKVKAKEVKAAKPYKIDSGIKLPDVAVRSGNGQPGRAAATVAMMKVGESFLVKEPFEAVQASKSLRDMMHRERKVGGTKMFTQRLMKGGTRFWRTK